MIFSTSAQSDQINQYMHVDRSGINKVCFFLEFITVAT